MRAKSRLHCQVAPWSDFRGSTQMIRKQLIVVAGALAGLLAAVLAACYSARLLSWVVLPEDDTASRLRFAARWLLLPGLTLLAGVMGAARRGFFTRTPSTERVHQRTSASRSTFAIT